MYFCDCHEKPIVIVAKVIIIPYQPGFIWSHLWSVSSSSQRHVSHSSPEWALSAASYSVWPYTEHTFSSIIHNLGGMLNNWSELGDLSAQPSFACSWWISKIQCTLQGARGNIVLNCVSVFAAFIDQLFSWAFWLWPTVWRRGPLLLLLLHGTRRLSHFSYCAAFSCSRYSTAHS